MDLVEEFRSFIVDRFVFSLINRGQLNEKHFDIKENGSVLLTEKAEQFSLKPGKSENILKSSIHLRRKSQIDVTALRSGTITCKGYSRRVGQLSSVYDIGAIL